jgi:broad-specificity NMP kinase
MYKHIREPILSDITAKDFQIIGFTLTCSEKVLEERHRKRGDFTEVSYEWLRLMPYEGDYVINTDNKTIQQIVDEMKEIINEK